MEYVISLCDAIVSLIVEWSSRQVKVFWGEVWDSEAREGKCGVTLDEFEPLYSLQLIILKNLFINQRDKLLGFSFLQIFMVFERHWGIWRFWTQVHRVKVIIRTCHLGRSGHQPDISYRYRVSVYASFMSNRYESSKFTSGQRQYTLRPTSVYFEYVVRFKMVLQDEVELSLNDRLN